MKKSIILLAVIASMISCTTNTAPATEVADTTKVAVKDTVKVIKADTAKVKADSTKTK